MTENRRSVRAITLTRLFVGQRSDEIARLRVGCIHWWLVSEEPVVRVVAGADRRLNANLNLTGNFITA